MRAPQSLAAAVLVLPLLGGVPGCGSSGPKGDSSADPDGAYRGIISAQKEAAM
jgi:hypothetical protein